MKFWELVWWGGVKNCQNLTSKVNLLSQQLSESFSFFSLKNTNLEANFLSWHFLWRQFLNHFVTNVMPNFWQLATKLILKIW